MIQASYILDNNISNVITQQKINTLHCNNKVLNPKTTSFDLCARNTTSYVYTICNNTVQYI